MNNKKGPIITNDKKPNVDLSDEYFGESAKPRQNALTFIFIIVATFSFIALGWYVYKINNTIKSVDELEVIHADHGITKVMPEDPGGMAIPDMDKSIYDNLNTSNHGKILKDEKIIPAPEEPLIHNPIPSDEIKPIEKIEPQVTEIHQEEPITNLNVNIADKENVKIVQKQSTKDDLKKKEKEIKQKLASKKKGFYVQVGSFKTENDASATWNKMHKKYVSVIGSSYYIERKDLGNKGIFYRLQIGPYNSESEARLVCKKLQAYHYSCFIVR